MKMYGEWWHTSTHSRPWHLEVRGQFQAQAALPPKKQHQVPLERKVRGPQSRSGRDDDENIPHICNYELYALTNRRASIKVTSIGCG
jgi:hypothetical protein